MEKEINLYKLFPAQKAVLSIVVSTIDGTEIEQAQAHLMFTDMVSKTVSCAVYFISDSENIDITDQIAYLSRNILDTTKDEQVEAIKEKLASVAKINTALEVGGVAMLRFGIQYVESELVSTIRQKSKGVDHAKS